MLFTAFYPYAELILKLSQEYLCLSVAQVLTLDALPFTLTCTCSILGLFTHMAQYTQWITGECLNLAITLLPGATCLVGSITLNPVGKWPVLRLRRIPATP